MLKGSVKKDSMYGINLLSRVENDADHPIHNGIYMEAHHIVSGKGMDDAGGQLGKDLVSFGYNINHYKNVAFIPSTLKGACHLGVQPHRGNHTYKDDDKHPEDYHEAITNRLRTLKKRFPECGTNFNKTARDIVDMVDDLSNVIIGKIQKRSLFLTSIADSFGPENDVGCGNSGSVSLHKKVKCDSDRMHVGDVNKRNTGDVTPPKIGDNMSRFHKKYTLGVGR